MAPKPPPHPLSAPGLVGPVATLGGPGGAARQGRRRRGRAFEHARLVVDLPPSGAVPSGSAVDRLEAFFRRRGEARAPELLGLVAATLHAFSARRLRWVDHWEAAPLGWLPLPRATPDTPHEPVGAILQLLADGSAPGLAGATSFSARLTDLSGHRADFRLRSRRRNGRGALTIDLRGGWEAAEVSGLETAIRARLPVVELRLDTFRYAE